MNKYLTHGIEEDYADNSITRKYAGSDIADGVAIFEHAARTARDYSPLPEFTDALIGLMGKAALGLVGGPISDQAELLAVIAKLARRRP